MTTAELGLAHEFVAVGAVAVVPPVSGNIADADTMVYPGMSELEEPDTAAVKVGAVAPVVPRPEVDVGTGEQSGLDPTKLQDEIGSSDGRRVDEWAIGMTRSCFAALVVEFVVVGDAAVASEARYAAALVPEEPD